MIRAHDLFERILKIEAGFYCYIIRLDLHVYSFIALKLSCIWSNASIQMSFTLFKAFLKISWIDVNPLVLTFASFTSTQRFPWRMFFFQGNKKKCDREQDQILTVLLIPFTHSVVTDFELPWKSDPQFLLQLFSFINSRLKVVDSIYQSHQNVRR